MSTEEQVRDRRAIEALRNGVPNRDAVAALGCNQPKIEELFLRQLQHTKQAITNGYKNEGMLVAGDFGTGKSHLLEYLTHLALEQNFVCSRIVISKETPLHDPVKLYRAAAEAAIVPGKRGSAMTEIAAALDKKRETYADFYQWVHQKSRLNSRFAATVFLFDQVPKDDEFSNRIIGFWSGDKIGAGELKSTLKACGEPASYKIDTVPERELALQRFIFAARLIVAAGYSGWVLLIDELELIASYSLLQRAKSYAALARWMGKLDDSNMAGLTSVLTISQDFQSVFLEEKNDREKVPGRLRAKGTQSDDLLALQAEKGIKVIAKEKELLIAPDHDVLAKTCERVRSIHAAAYNWSPPPVPSIQGMTSTRMRQYIRGWITHWDLKRLDSEYTPEIEVLRLEPDYTLAPDYDDDNNPAIETQGDETPVAQE